MNFGSVSEIVCLEMCINAADADLSAPETSVCCSYIIMLNFFENFFRRQRKLNIFLCVSREQG